jgi:hypothetical protein
MAKITEQKFIEMLEELVGMKEDEWWVELWVELCPEPIQLLEEA